MKDVGVTLQSQLSVQDAAAVFQQTADDARGIKAKMIERSASRYGNDHLHGFFTPNDNSVFSAIDDDRPDFTVGVGIAKGNLMHGTRSGDADVIQLYVWDRGNSRELHLFSPYTGLGKGRSEKLVQRFVNAYQAADSQIQGAGPGSDGMTADQGVGDPSQPAGWLADQTGRFEFRYWDGSAWSSHVSTSGNVQVDTM